MSPVAIAPDVEGIRETDEERRARIEAHPYMDPRLKALLLDKTLVSVKELSAELGITRTTAYDWAAPRMEERRPHPHPRMLPVEDGPLPAEGMRPGGREPAGRQAGRLREWAMHKGWVYWHRGLGQLVRAPRVHRGGPQKKPRTRQT